MIKRKTNKLFLTHKMVTLYFAFEAFQQGTISKWFPKQQQRSKHADKSLACLLWKQATNMSVIFD